MLAPSTQRQLGAQYLHRPKGEGYRSQIPLTGTCTGKGLLLVDSFVLGLRALGLRTWTV